MSQTYVLELRAKVCDVRKAKDTVVTKISLIKIVSDDEQKEILKKILKDRGFEPEDGNEQVWVRKKGQLAQKVDLQDMTVSTTVEKEEKIERKKRISVERRGKGAEDAGYSEEQEEEENEKLRKLEQAKLEKSLEITEAEKEEINAKLVKEITAVFEETEEERMTELNEIVKDVYAESLKKKAAKMGKVTSVKETKDDKGNYELRIKLTE